jgi:hypothetical protein
VSKNNVFIRIGLIFVLYMFHHSAYPLDTVKFQRQQMSVKKTSHNIKVIRRSLEITQPEYGSFKLEIVDVDMSAIRMRSATADGKIINTVIVPASEQWDKHNIPVRIPVRLGLLSYRILLVNEVDLPSFDKVTTLHELNNFTAGLVKGWTTTEIYKSNKMNFVATGHFNGMFQMLDKQRFDYIPRGIYEIYDELEERNTLLKSVVVEPSLALYIPTSSYVYVSPTQPRLAKRIELGLGKLMANGELKEILFEFYESDIKRANLAGRKILEVANTYHNKKDKHLINIH